MEAQNAFPTYEAVQHRPETVKISIHVLTKSESEHVPQEVRESFASDGQVTHHVNGTQTHYITPEKIKDFPIKKDTYVEFSNKVSEAGDYYGAASDLLSCHKYNRKSNRPAPPKVYVNKNTKDLDHVLNLTKARNQNVELCNGRGDEEGTPCFFEKVAKSIAVKYGVEVTIIKGDDLVKEGFRLMHAVGRASRNPPVFVNLKYQGNPDSTHWVSYVGKGVCFDSGGLNIKPASGMKDMYMDKCGAVSVLTAFQYVVQEKLKINLTVSMGWVENFISSNSYRPSDIIASRKGITVEIGNTDAEGRLVLADCMHWTQEKYKTDVLIQLSTLTGAIISALGHRFAGLFTNDEGLKNDLIAVGKKVREESWHMPIDDYHRDIIKHKEADITNLPARSAEGGSSQAGAFLEHFVEKGTKWIHLDIAGTSIVGSEATGYGARLLLEYARHYASKK